MNNNFSLLKNEMKKENIATKFKTWKFPIFWKSEFKSPGKAIEYWALKRATCLLRRLRVHSK
jgi:hypothetical protein